MTDAPPAPSPASPAQTALGDLAQELATTRRVLERVPDDRWGWKPPEKSMALGQLAGHITTLPLWGVQTMAEDHVDFAAPPALPPAPRDRAELLARWDENVAHLRAAVDGADAAALAVPYTVRRGAQVLMQMPRAAMVRAMVVSHMIHHRAQLTVYFRLLDVPVPAVYGPTADEGRA